MADEPLWPQARALRDTLRQELARDPHWRVWSIEEVFAPETSTSFTPLAETTCDV